MLFSFDYPLSSLNHRACQSMSGISGPAICYAAKIFSGSPYDHIGIVVEDLDGPQCDVNNNNNNNNNNPGGGGGGGGTIRNKLYMLEANFGGVTCYPLHDRIEKTKVSNIYAIYTEHSWCLNEFKIS